MRKANAAIPILGLGLALLLAWAPIAGADTYTYTYNAADQLASVQGSNGAASYTYDGDGQRITRATAAGQTIYVRGPQGEVIAEYSGTTGALLAECVYLDGQRLCKITHDAQGIEHRVYYHQDVVGTPVAETNESGQVLVRANYYPFGEEVIPGAASDPHKFTGKELDDESGLYYFGARYYDAHVGRFVSVDPVGGTDDDPQSWNRYAYAENRPTVKRDPTGKCVEDVCVGEAMAVAALAGATAAWLGSPSPTHPGMTNAQAFGDSMRNLVHQALQAAGRLAPNQPGTKSGKSQPYDQARRAFKTQYNNEGPPGGPRRPGGDIPPGAPGPNFKPRDLGPSPSESDIFRLTQPNFPLAGLAVGLNLFTFDQQLQQISPPTPTFQQWENNEAIQNLGNAMPSAN